MIPNVLTKSVPKSFFLWCNINSPLSEILLSDKPVMSEKPLTVLQILPVESNKLLLECIYNVDIKTLN